MASSRKPFDWFCYQVGMHSFRAFAEGKATWILNYSWDGDKNVDARQSMMNLAMSQVMAGANFWDAPGHSMAGSNDLPMRKAIFPWIKAHENTFYRPRTPIAPVGVYFSPQTRNFHAREFIASYRGILILLLQKHLEFQIVTPRTLADFSGSTLILPDVRVLSETEKAGLRAYLGRNKLLLFTGEDATKLRDNPDIIRFSKCPGKNYSASLQKDFESSNPDQEHEFLQSLKSDAAVRVVASPMIATSIARVDGTPHVFFANFAGLRGGANPVQTPQAGVQVTVTGTTKRHGFFLPFLGETQPLYGTVGNDGVTYKLPAIEKGAVFWYEP
jgi:hypothetical protein